MKIIRLDPSTGLDVPISLAVSHGGIVYVSGHVAYAPGTKDPLPGGIREQTRHTLGLIDDVLAKAGTDRSRLLKLTVFLTDIRRDFAGMNEVFRAWIGDHRPARSTIETRLAVEGLLVEIEAVAAAAPATRP